MRVMLVLRGFQNTNLLVLLGGLLLCLVFMIQVKQIYNNNQKYNRYLGYKEYVRSHLTNQRNSVLVRDREMLINVYFRWMKSPRNWKRSKSLQTSPRLTFVSWMKFFWNIVKEVWKTFPYRALFFHYKVFRWV